MPGRPLAHAEVAQARPGGGAARPPVVEHLDLGVGRRRCGPPRAAPRAPSGRSSAWWCWRAPPARRGRATAPAEPEAVVPHRGWTRRRRSAVTRPAAVRSAASAGRSSTPGSGARPSRSPASSPRSRRVPSRLRIWVTASREERSMSPRAARRGIRVAVDDPPRGRRLDADDRHVVADDVVQLAGDAQPLVGDGATAQGVALGADGGWPARPAAPSAGRCATRPGRRAPRPRSRRR